jgi:hypothetical protein
MTSENNFTGSAATPAAGSPAPAAVPAAGSKFSRGVSFYSYQIIYHTGQISTEGLIAEAASIGANAIEMLPDCNIPNFPNVSDEWVKNWHGWMEKYHTVADTYTQHLDEVSVDRLVWDMQLAKRLGFRFIRLMLGTPADLVEKCLPTAEKLGLPMLVEVHGPVRIDSEQVAAFVKIMEKTRSPYFGINPDFSLWQRRPVRVIRDLRIRKGVLKEDIAKYIDQALEQQVPKEKAAAEVVKMGGGDREKQYLETAYDGYQDPKKLLPLKPYIRRFHGKFFEMTEDYKEFSIPYEEVVPFLIQNGFEGVIASEYEGGRQIMDAFPVEEIEQVRRHQVMLKRLLGV